MFCLTILCMTWWQPQLYSIDFMKPAHLKVENKWMGRHFVGCIVRPTALVLFNTSSNWWHFAENVGICMSIGHYEWFQLAPLWHAGRRHIANQFLTLFLYDNKVILQSYQMFCSKIHCFTSVTHIDAIITLGIGLLLQKYERIIDELQSCNDEWFILTDDCNGDQDVFCIKSESFCFKENCFVSTLVTIQ